MKILDAIKFIHAMSLAERTYLPEETMLKLAKHKDKIVRQDLAQNKNLSEAAQIVLANDVDEDVRASLAKNAILKPILQTKLVNDQSAWVRSHLADNPMIKEEIQKKLATDQDLWTRCDLARNPSLLLNIAIILYFDIDETVISSFKTYNPNLYNQVIQLESTVLQENNLNLIKLNRDKKMKSLVHKLIVKKTNELEIF